jgi:hypothetical protein
MSKTREIQRSQIARANGKTSLMFGSSLADVFRTPDYDCRGLKRSSESKLY